MPYVQRVPAWELWGLHAKDDRPCRQTSSRGVDAAKASGREVHEIRPGRLDPYIQGKARESRLKIIGDGGHARVVRDLLEDQDFATCGDVAAIIAVGDNRARKKEAEAWDGPFIIATHNRAVIGGDVLIGAGTVVMAGAVIQPGCRIGRHVIINTGATVDHDCVIEDYAHIAPGAHLCGHVKVGEGALVGVGVGVAPRAVIPPWTLVKARRLEYEAIPSN